MKRELTAVEVLKLLKLQIKVFLVYSVQFWRGLVFFLSFASLLLPSLCHLSMGTSKDEGKRSLKNLEEEEEDEDEEESGGLGFGFGDEDDKKKKGKTEYSAAAGGSSMPQGFCQADDCTADMTDAKRYHKRHKVCEFHAKTPFVPVNGIQQRFCQQCSRFHELSEFDDNKKSCRRRLAGHNERRRKTSNEYHGEGSI